MKRIILNSILYVAFIAFATAPMYAQKTISLPYIESSGMPGSIIENIENINNTKTQYQWQSPIYTLEQEANGIRLTFIDSNYYLQHNNHHMVALSELHFFDGNGEELPYDINTLKYNSLEGIEGSIEALYDNDYTTYYHSVWAFAIVDNTDAVYLEVDFQQPVSEFSFSYRTRNTAIAPLSIALTETGNAYVEGSASGGDNEGVNTPDEDDNKQETPVTNLPLVDIYETPCLFVELSNGNIDAIPLESIKGEYYTNEGTLVVPLVSGTSIEYPDNSYTKYGTAAPQLPEMTSYKFNNKYNPNLNIDIEATAIAPQIDFNIRNAIGKNLTASFQLSDSRAVAYVNNKLQISKETRNRFDEAVNYIVTYPGYNIVRYTKVQDEIWDYGENIIEEIPLSAEMLYTNKPSQVGDALENMLDNNPETIFHTLYGANYDASVIPYITITLDEPIETARFYYMTRTSGNYNPKQLNLYASNDNLSWTLIKSFSSEADDLPLEPAGAEYTSPDIPLGDSYRYLKLEQTESEYHNNHMVFAEFRLYNVLPGSGDSTKLQDAVYEHVRTPFGRIYTINTNWATDNGILPRIDIDIEDGRTVTDKINYLSASFRITGNGVYDDFADSVQIKGRGNTTWGYAKKPYRLKFAEKVKPFGLTKGKSWVLLANAQNGALMANAIAMKVGQLAGASYTNHIIPVELYINGEYKGNYMFTEHIGFSNNSVDIDEDLGTGYMLELDSYYDEDYKFRSAYYNLPVNIKEPDLSDYDAATADEKFINIQNDFNKLETLLYNGGDLSAILDLDAAARFMLTNELVMNQELGHPKSTYLWREDFTSENSLITLGPIWDFDYAFGYEGTGSYFNIGSRTDYFSGMPSSSNGRSFFRTLMNDKEFQRHYYKVWKEFVDNGHIQEVADYIDDYYRFSRNSFENNATIWGDGYNYGAIIEKMQTWMQQRHDYIFSNLAQYDINDLIHTLQGDVDCNDALTVLDIALLADYLRGIVNPALNTIKADTDKSGTINGNDLITTASLVVSSESVTPLYIHNTPQATATITTTEFKAETDKNSSFPITFATNGADTYKALQMDITVPMGMIITDATAGSCITGKEFIYTQIGENSYRILAYCNDGTHFDSAGTVANLSLYTSEQIPANECHIDISNILIVDSDNIEQRIDECSANFSFSETPRYTVTFVVDGEVYQTLNVEYGAKITTPEAPEREGYTFTGWNNVPQTMPAENITVGGAFRINSYTVTFVVDGEVYQTLNVEYGAEITTPEAPEREGCTFIGWNNVPQTMPAENITVGGAFGINSYTVTFVVDGEVYDSLSVEYGAKITTPEAPEREGYTFTGWSNVPQTMPAEDIEIKGEYILNTGISTINTDTRNNEIYNLKGLRITDKEQLTRGFYIINGKKIFIK